MPLCESFVPSWRPRPWQLQHRVRPLVASCYEPSTDLGFVRPAVPPWQSCRQRIFVALTEAPVRDNTATTLGRAIAVEEAHGPRADLQEVHRLHEVMTPELGKDLRSAGIAYAETGSDGRNHLAARARAVAALAGAAPRA